MRAANCQRSPRSAPPPLPEVQHSKTSTATGTTTSSRNNNNPTPLTSTGSTTSSSSGYSSINTADPMDHTATAVPNTVDYACPPTNNNNSVVPVPTVSSSSNESSSGNCRIIPIIKVKKREYLDSKDSKTFSCLRPFNFNGKFLVRAHGKLCRLL